MYEHLNPLKNKLLSLNIGEAPSPWKRVATVAIGGLRSLGFDQESENLLILSSQGRGVIDCLTGEKIARDDEEFYEGETYGFSCAERSLVIATTSDVTIFVR
jgi:hypothetical protein